MNEPASDRVIITLHGIRTYGNWQRRLEQILAGVPATRVVRYVYGYFSVLAFLFPPLRWLVTRRFRRELLRIAAENPRSDLYLVAHSFGTHLAAWALAGIPRERRPRLHTIILAGSVLRPTFNWSELISDGTVGRVVNDCGIGDNILALNQLVVLFTGMAGRLGFVGVEDDRFTNRFFTGGHSLYFEPRWGQSDDAFMIRYWVPLLTTDARIEPADERTPPTALEGAWVTILQNAEPIKLAVYSLLLIIPTVVVFSLWQSAKQERDRAQIALANEQLARQAEQVAQAGEARQRGIADTALVRRDEARERFAEALDLVENRAVRWPFNRASLNDTTARLLSGLMTGIQQTGYAGEIVVEGHVGRFCVTPGSGDDPVLAPDSLPIAKCDFYPASQAYSLGLSNRLGNSLKSFLAAQVAFPAGQIAIAPYGVERPRVPYPASGVARDWNAVARQNNRVEVHIAGAR